MKGRPQQQVYCTETNKSEAFSQQRLLPSRQIDAIIIQSEPALAPTEMNESSQQCHQSLRPLWHFKIKKVLFAMVHLWQICIQGKNKLSNNGMRISSKPRVKPG